MTKLHVDKVNGRPKTSAPIGNEQRIFLLTNHRFFEIVRVFISRCR